MLGPPTRPASWLYRRDRLYITRGLSGVYECVHPAVISHHRSREAAVDHATSSTFPFAHLPHMLRAERLHYSDVIPDGKMRDTSLSSRCRAG